MKIENLTISNFRGIQHLEAPNLGDTIIIAGQNGSGKSCIFDAIRLLKSTYGGYQQNEWQHFFGEFQIQLTGGSQNIKGLFNDATRDCIIDIDFSLRDPERRYIFENSRSLLEQTIWQILLPEAFAYGGYQKALFAQQFRDRQQEVADRISRELPSLLLELKQPSLKGRLQIHPNGSFQLAPSFVLSVVFSNYSPRNIGVIDFHGAQRHYGRENVSGINLSLDQQTQQYSQHTLYNYNNKYNNVKSEMAGNYVKELLAEKAAARISDRGKTLTQTLKELFESFFPEKTFLGPQPNAEGGLDFPVQTQNGSIHDLDELSAGEKEILYGYLRIRSSAPANSIILLDEPELHLNPRLIRGLPEFYRKHLGEALNNQLWLVTHSDALIREAVGKPGFNVFHMLPCGAEASGTSQLKALNVTEDRDAVLADLVGDLAAFRPGGKGLIFEGGGGSDFDKTFAAALFPEELRGINLISGTNKMRVKLLHEILERAYSKGDLPTKFYAVMDGDSDDPKEPGRAVTTFQWDVYHIENYLLESDIIASVVSAIKNSRISSNRVERRLLECAEGVMPSVIAHRLRSHANSQLIKAIDLGFAPQAQDNAQALHDALSRSKDRLKHVLSEGLTAESLKAEEARFRVAIEASLSDGSWMKVLPGREILKRYVDAEKLGVPYEVMRNLVMGRMAESGHKPAGMKQVIDRVVAD